MRTRIQTLDGLRFLAALGVLWIHAWTIHGNPRYYIGRLDIASVLAIGGNGVDLFFVISGFCMYYFYGSKTIFTPADFYRFLIKRWVRLSPAFYTAALIYLLYNIFAGHQHANIPANISTSIFYLNSIFPQFNIAPHFWTLGVEWQFYLIIPILLMYQCRAGFDKIFFYLFGALFLSALVSVMVFKAHFDLLTDQLIFRGVEFGAGVYVARLLLKDIFYLKKRKLWLPAFILLSYAGRVLISKPVLALSADFYNVFKLFGFTLLSSGFAGILYLSLTSAKWLKLILGSRLLTTMGRISYSFYLWHAMLVPVIAGFTVKYFPFINGILAPVMTTCLCAIILFPIAGISFAFLEKPFLSFGNLTKK
ncbi:acyltransferase family protein [Mucilaginibacter corticis]|uniref:acyltransferase family protein n=1 Tax=Mucilaginibacter corticis TaxID=2597670 RepID=UPI0016434F83|nr:acyltransferase [Mucilaginibacter corticis]